VIAVELELPLQRIRDAPVGYLRLRSESRTTNQTDGKRQLLVRDREPAG
jgi:hypothetical protein